MTDRSTRRDLSTEDLAILLEVTRSAAPRADRLREICGVASGPLSGIAPAQPARSTARRCAVLSAAVHRALAACQGHPHAARERL